jgi:hypothetical protein
MSSRFQRVKRIRELQTAGYLDAQLRWAPVATREPEAVAG